MDVLSAPAPATRRPTLSVVVPAYNEEAVLGEFHRRLAAVLDGLPLDADLQDPPELIAYAGYRLLREIPR